MIMKRVVGRIGEVHWHALTQSIRMVYIDNLLNLGLKLHNATFHRKLLCVMHTSKARAVCETIVCWEAKVLQSQIIKLYNCILPHSIYLIDFDSPQCRDFDSPQCRRNRGVWCHNLWLPVRVGNLFTASVSLKGHEQQQLLAWHDWWFCISIKTKMPVFLKRSLGNTIFNTSDLRTALKMHYL